MTIDHEKLEHLQLQELIRVVEGMLTPAWRDYLKYESELMHASNDFSDPGDGFSIEHFPISFDQVIRSRVELLLKHSKFSLKIYEAECLAPSGIVDWLKKWKILEAPNMAIWMAANGEKYPRFYNYVVLLDTLRILLLSYHNRFPERTSTEF